MPASGYLNATRISSALCAIAEMEKFFSGMTVSDLLKSTSSRFRDSFFIGRSTFGTTGAGDEMIAAGAKAAGPGVGTVGSAIGGRLGVMSFVSSLNCTSDLTFGKEAEEEGPEVDELVLKDTSPKVDVVGVISFGVTGRTGDADSWVEDSMEVLSSDEGS